MFKKKISICGGCRLEALAARDLLAFKIICCSESLKIRIKGMKLKELYFILHPTLVSMYLLAAILSRKGNWQ
jgi:hypothetical protein